MTLILNFASPAFCLHASDRMVTRSGLTYDLNANKTLLFSGRDAYIAFGYTGLAYIGKKTTDDWLADAILGVPFVGSISGVKVALELAPFPRHGTLGSALGRISEAIVRDFKILPSTERSQRFSVGYTGWYRRHHTWLPVLGSIAKVEGGLTVHHEGSWRTTSVRNANFWVSGGWIDTIPEIRTRLASAIHNAPRTASSSLAKAEYLRDALIDVIKFAASRTSLIGSDVLTVMLDHPRNAPETVPPSSGIWLTGPLVRSGSDSPAIVESWPLRTQMRAVDPLRPDSHLPIAFGPWIIGQTTRVAPTQFSGRVGYFAHPMTVLLRTNHAEDFTWIEAQQRTSRR